jgi:hypothetical protein
MLEYVPWIPLYQHNLLLGVEKSIQWRPIPSGRIEFRQYNLSFAG